MLYKVEIKRQARQKLKSLSRPDRVRITDAIDELSTEPDAATLDFKPMEGTNFYRLRVGELFFQGLTV
jgi:mRNA-degrading endonuclease RelE of RelBE toxin-antitoxin system